MDRQERAKDSRDQFVKSQPLLEPVLHPTVDSDRILDVSDPAGDRTDGRHRILRLTPAA